MPSTHSPSIHAVDLFCGIGGLTHGVQNEGITVGAGIDIESSCKHAYETNNSPAKFIPSDIQDIKFSDIAKYYEKADYKLLMGCAPCQPFSAHTRKNSSSSDDGKCLLIKEFSRLVQEGDLDIVSMENVPGLAKHPEFSNFLNLLEEMGYHTWVDVVSCADYGVPQKRKRLVLLASKLGAISLLPPLKQRKRVVSDFIEKMPPVESGKSQKKDRFHISLSLSEKNLKRIRQSVAGGKRENWTDDIKCKCHENAHYPAPYGRMEWGVPAPTITTQFCYYSTGRFGHPDQDRTITLREAALLQTFPRKYEFVPKGEKIVIKNMARHIGNAVPVKLAEIIGKSIRKHINNVR